MSHAIEANNAQVVELLLAGDRLDEQVNFQARVRHPSFITYTQHYPVTNLGLAVLFGHEDLVRTILQSRVLTSCDGNALLGCAFSSPFLAPSMINLIVEGHGCVIGADINKPTTMTAVAARTGPMVDAVLAVPLKFLVGNYFLAWRHGSLPIDLRALIRLLLGVPVTSLDVTSERFSSTSNTLEPLATALDRYLVNMVIHHPRFHPSVFLRKGISDIMNQLFGGRNPRALVAALRKFYGQTALPHVLEKCEDIVLDILGALFHAFTSTFEPLYREIRGEIWDYASEVGWKRVCHDFRDKNSVDDRLKGMQTVPDPAGQASPAADATSMPDLASAAQRSVLSAPTTPGPSSPQRSSADLSRPPSLQASSEPGGSQRPISRRATPQLLVFQPPEEPSNPTAASPVDWRTIAESEDLSAIPSSLANSVDVSGNTLTGYLSMMGRTRELRQLIGRSDISFGAQNVYGCTPLILSLQFQRPEVARIIVEHAGANINARDMTDRTALGYALDEDIISILAALGGET